MNIAAHIEVASNHNFVRVEERHKVAKNIVGDILVKDFFVTKLINVQF